MKKIETITLLLLLSIVFSGAKAQEVPFSKAKIFVSAAVKKSFEQGGRILLHLTKQREKEPRLKSELVIGLTPANWAGSVPLEFDSRTKNILIFTTEKNLPLAAEKYYYQAVYKQNKDDGQENVPGNLYSNVDSVVLTPNAKLKLTLNKVIPPVEIIDHPFVKSVVIKSKLLSDFSGRARFLKASILLPSGFFKNPGKNYPICYRAPGLNGRYNAVNGHINNKEFTDWWFTDDAPQVIYVYLDSQGPYGDTYQVDSENNGPCGKALTEELIPEIEKLVHYNPATKMRFLTGYSTGGWVSLGLQIFYPDFFDGTWSYSPDPVDFSHYGLIDIYQDSSIFYNKFGYLQPGKRTIYDEPTYSMKEWISAENTSGRNGDYRISGGQFGAYNAVFGPKGADGLPSLMFDPVTGKIDHTIAVQWEKYDLKKVLEKNWSTLGPKLQGKIWIWTGDADGLYSNVATRFLKMYLDSTKNPKSDAKISFTPLAGHCQEWSDKVLLKMVADKAAAK